MCTLVEFLIAGIANFPKIDKTPAGACQPTETTIETPNPSLLTQLLKLATDEVYVFHADDLRCVDASRSAVRQSGIPYAELVGACILDRVVDDEREALAALIGELENGQETTLRTRLAPAWTCLRADGNSYRAHVALSIGADEAGLSLLTIRQSDTADLARDRIERMDLACAMAARMAHDFNNVLGVVVGNLDLVKRQVSEPKMESRVDAALEATLRGIDLAGRLGEMTRQVPYAPQPTVLNHLLERGGTWRERLPGQVSLRLDLAAELWSTEVDRDEFESAVRHLIENAVEACGSGGSIEVQTLNAGSLGRAVGNGSAAPARATQYVMLRVSDTGAGMDADTREQAFDPYFSTHHERGRGLGLTAVYRFAERHGGLVRLYSEPGNGTDVLIYLPSASSAHDNAAHGGAADSHLEGSETLLLVDDESALLTMTRELLSGYGYTVLTANNARSARMLLAEQSVELVFSDVVMPGDMDGFALAAYIEAHYPDCPVLLTSGFASRRQATEHTDLPAPDLARSIVAKPYHLDNLLRLIRTTLDDPPVP
ncbi:MAG: ATP-binding protein [Pseudomonadota bacterium]